MKKNYFIKFLERPAHTFKGCVYTLAPNEMELESFPSIDWNIFLNFVYLAHVNYFSVVSIYQTSKALRFCTVKAKNFYAPEK